MIIITRRNGDYIGLRFLTIKSTTDYNYVLIKGIQIIIIIRTYFTIDSIVLVPQLVLRVKNVSLRDAHSISTPPPVLMNICHVKQLAWKSFIVRHARRPSRKMPEKNERRERR